MRSLELFLLALVGFQLLVTAFTDTTLDPTPTLLLLIVAILINWRDE